jgi:putative MATE family efflux protein
MVMESVFALVDVIFVSRLGVDAVAAVGLTEGLLSVLYAVAMGLGMGTTALVSRRVGEGDPRGAADAAVQAILLAAGLSVAIAVPGVVFAGDLLRLMGGSPEVVAGGRGYIAVILGGNATIVLIFVINAVFRGAGDAAAAMKALWLANAINIVLDPCLIFGLGPFPELGLTGAAIATTIGRGTGVAYQVWLLSRGRGRVRVHPARDQLRFQPTVMWSLVRVSLGGIGQFLISTASWVVLVRLVGGFGSAAVAGYTVAVRLAIFALLPSWGLANAAATLVGQNLGAGRVDRARRSAWRTSWANAAFLGALGLVFVVWARPLVRLLSDEPAILDHAVSCLRIFAYGYPFYAMGMVMVQALNGAGDTVTPTRINLFCYWLFQLPLAWLLSTRTSLGVDGVFWAVPVAEAAMTVTAMVAFRRGRWARREV